MKRTLGSNGVQVFLLFLASILFMGATAMQEEGKQRILLDFEQSGDAANWTVINDVVMGGVSSSRFVVEKPGTAVFSGVVSLENNGGFASANMKPAQFDVSDYDGIRFRVKGDGKSYKITLKNDGAFNGFSYRFEFTSKDGEWLTVDAPFSSFVPKFMGETTSAPPVDRARIKTFGFLIADKQNGPFRLEIDWIGAYRR
jgi:monofunctional biosynthetic peptidoglycan transglycosylase